MGDVGHLAAKAGRTDERLRDPTDLAVIVEQQTGGRFSSKCGALAPCPALEEKSSQAGRSRSSARRRMGGIGAEAYLLAWATTCDRSFLRYAAAPGHSAQEPS
jgi:hypothetical protein